MKRLVLLALIIVPVGGCSSGPKNPDGGGGGPGPTSWLAGGNGQLASTSDGTAFARRGSPTSADLYSLVCVGHQLGWAGGAGGTVIHTTDGGESWRTQATPTRAGL